MKDLISREEAKKAIADYLARKMDIVNPIDTATLILAIVRSEQPTQKWIPCSERPPAGQEEVIVSCRDDAGDSRFDYTASGWITTDGEYWIVDNEINHYVVAWMPLPKPWRGEQP